MSKLHIISRNSGLIEEVLNYSTNDTVSDVYTKIRTKYNFSPDVRIVFFNIGDLGQNAQQANLQGNQPMCSYFPDGGRVYLEAHKTPNNVRQEQGNAKIGRNTAIDEAKQQNIISIQSDKIKAEVFDNQASNKAMQNNYIGDGPVESSDLAAMLSMK